MLNQPTLEKLHAMRLGAMALAWQEQQADAKLATVDFDARFGLIVEAEHLARDNRRLKRLLKNAQLRFPDACVEDIDASKPRGLEAATVRQLSTCAWIGEHLNVLVTGATGVGKSYVACALGQLACRRGKRVLYRRMPRLFDELSLAKAEGTYAKLLRKLATLDLLVIDDLGLGVITPAQRHDLLEVLEDRYALRSTIVTSQLPPDKWHTWIGDPTLADAILDRLVHNAYKVTLKGGSRRKTKK
ncbi:MAG: IS21-like element helper ATPase IstB [Bacteroidota bacterium]